MVPRCWRTRGATRGARMGLQVALLYFANTAGAALVRSPAPTCHPALGAHRTTLIAAVLNLLVGLGALSTRDGRSGSRAPPAPSRRRRRAPRRRFCRRPPSPRWPWAACSRSGWRCSACTCCRSSWPANSAYGLMVSTFLSACRPAAARGACCCIRAPTPARRWAGAALGCRSRCRSAPGPGTRSRATSPASTNTRS